MYGQHTKKRATKESGGAMKITFKKKAPAAAEAEDASKGASGAAEKPKITRKTPSCSASPQMTRDLGDVRCCTRCMLRMVTRPISVKVVVTCGAKMRDTYSTAETGMRRTVPWWQAALRRRCALT